MRNLIVHNRQLTQQDTKALYREPWGMVRPIRARIYSLPAAAASGSSFRYYMAT